MPEQEEPTTEFYYHVLAVMKITLEEIELLRELAAAHYDGVCKAAGVAGPDGFLWGMRTHAMYTEEKPPEHTMTQRNIDTLLKILEGLQYADKEKWPLGLEVQKKFRKAFREISAEWHRLNPQDAPKT